MFNRFILYLFLVLCYACNQNKNDETFSPNKIKLVQLLEQGKNNEFEVSKRLKFIDTAFTKIAKKSIMDSLSLAIVASKANLHYKLKQSDSSLFYDCYLLKKARQSSNKYYLGKAHFNIALYLDNIQNFDSAFYHYNLSKGFFNELNDSSQVGRRLMSMAMIQKNQNDFFGSKETTTEALQFLNSKKDSKYIASSYNTLGTSHRKLLNYKEAVKYFKMAIRKTGSKKNKLAYKNNLAATYIDDKKYNYAITILEQIKVDTTLKRTSSQYARVLDNLAFAKLLSGNTNKQDFLKPLQLRKQNNDQRGQIASYTHLGEFYSKTHTIKATCYFDSVIQLSKTLKIPRAEKDALKFLMKLEPKNVKIRDRYVFLQDSLYEQETKVKTQFAKYKYDDTVTQEENTRLEKENAEKELEASQQRNQKILYLGGLLFITSVLGLSLYGFRQRTKRLKQKSKTERLKAIHETEAILSRKLHDDHGGKLNQAMLLVQRDAAKSAILDILELVYNQIRNFSREINTVDTGPEFWKGLKATLEYTKPTEVEMTFDGGKELDWSLVSHQTKTILFKVLQELVINMARHSKANQTVILFKDQNKELFIYYEDDGVGASKESLSRKNGLQNTEKRIQAIGGSITFDSEEGKGFRAEIRIPK